MAAGHLTAPQPFASMKKWTSDTFVLEHQRVAEALLTDITMTLVRSSQGFKLRGVMSHNGDFFPPGAL